MANTTDKSILTAAGKALLAQLNAEEKPLIIDKMIFANVADRAEFPQSDDVVPTDDVVHQEQVEQRGRLSADSVIYSSTLTSDVGPFEFNWTGAYCSEYGVLVTIDHHALTPKTADEPGVAGNTLVRSVVLEYKDIAEITNITVDASSWQYNATPRMKKMDDDVAQTIIDQNGKDWFIEDGFLVTPLGSAYNIKAGAGYVSGNRVSMEFDRSVQVPNKPSLIYIDAYREGTPTGEQVTLFDFVVTAEEKEDYAEANGVKHFVCKIAQVLADGSVVDLRPEGTVNKKIEDAINKKRPQVTFYSNKNGEDIAAVIPELLNKGYRHFYIPPGEYVSLPNGPIIFEEVHGIKFEVDGELHQPKHGYDALVLDGANGHKVYGIGAISGPGVFPSKTFGGFSGGGEKAFCISQVGRWPVGRGNSDNGLGDFNDGFIGNGGCGVLIKNGASNIDIDIETFGHSYSGVCIGDPLLTSQDGEVRNRNITVDGSHHDNYDAGVSYHSVDGLVIKDSCKTYNNGHPDALESDDEINPGYGVTSRLTADSAESAIDIYLGGRHTFNKRKNVDAHSGQDIRVNAYSEGAMVYGAAFGGNSGARGRVMGSIICKDNGYASGALADKKTQCALSGEYDSTSLKMIIRGGQTAIPFTIDRIERIDLDVDVIAGSGAVKPEKPFAIIGTSVNPSNVNIKGSIGGTYSGGATASYCSGSVQNLDMSSCVYDSPGQSIVMSNCSFSFGLGNSFPHPQFNIGNSGDLIGAKSELVMSFNGTALPDIQYTSGQKYISQYYAGGNGPELSSVADSYLDSNTVVHSVQVSMRSAKDGNLSYLVAKDVSNTGKQRVSLGAYASNDILLGTNIVNNVVVFASITWGFQK